MVDKKQNTMLIYKYGLQFSKMDPYAKHSPLVVDPAICFTLMHDYFAHIYI